jgi:HSP20 family protein
MQAGADAARSGAQAASGVAASGLQAERRTFEEGAGAAASAASRGLDVAQGMARQSAERTRQLADDSRRAGAEIANAWREAWHPLFKAHLEATRWMDETWRQLTGLAAYPSLMTARPFAVSPAPLFGAPPTDVRETEDAYEIAIETPGVRREDLEVKLNGDMLTVCGQKADRAEQATSNYRVSERRFGSFARSFPVPPDSRREAIEANFAEGVLTIRLPKTEEARQPSSQIQIR